MKKVAVSTSMARPKRRASSKDFGHVGRLEEAAMDGHRKEALAMLLYLDALGGGTIGVSSTATWQMMIRSCRTLLCLRLCSSAPGTESPRGARKTAVPATRVGVLVGAGEQKIERHGFAADLFQMRAAADAPRLHHEEHAGGDQQRQPAALHDLERCWR